jgi:hypothetical protein
MLDHLINELRANPRLRWGLATIIGMGWLYGVLLLRDELHDQTQNYRNTVQSIDRLQAQLAEPEWPARAVAARSMAVQLEGRLWQAISPGLAQAAYQDWLTATLAKAGINNPQITVTVIEDTPANPPLSNSAAKGATLDSTASTPADLWKIRAKLSFEFNAAATMDLLARLENHEQQSVVKALTLRKEPAPRAELEVLAYFQKQTAGKP